MAANAAATSGSVGLASGGGSWPAARRTSATAIAEVGRAVVRLAERRSRDVAERRDGRGDGRPAQPRRALVRLGERPAGQEDGGDRELGGRQVAQVVREDRRLLGRPGGRREALGELAPATHRTMVYRARDGAADVVPGGPDRRRGSCCDGTSRRTSARSCAGTRTPRSPGSRATRRPRCAPRRSSASSPPAWSGLTRWRWPSTRRVRSSGRDLRVQPARRRERVGAVPHHHRRVRCLGPRLRDRGDPADARPRVRDARAPPDRAVRVRVQRAGDPRVPPLRVRRRGPVARIDLARRPLVGRAGDERPRIGLAGEARRQALRAAGAGTEPQPSAEVGPVAEVAAAPSDRLRRTLGRWR